MTLHVNKRTACSWIFERDFLQVYLLEEGK